MLFVDIPGCSASVGSLGGAALGGKGAGRGKEPSGTRGQGRMCNPCNVSDMETGGVVPANHLGGTDTPRMG